MGLNDVVIAPTVNFLCFLVEAKDSEKVFHALKDILYVPAEATKTNKRKFNLKVHGGFLPFKPLPFGDYFSWEE